MNLGLIYKTWLDQLLPRSCALCFCPIAHLKNAERYSHADICHVCLHHFFNQTTLRCKICANKLDAVATASLCGSCLANPPTYDRTIAVADYVAPYNTLVHALKFQHHLALAPLFAQLLALSWHQSQSTSADIMTAIPLSAERLIERGFNQSLEIAKPLAKILSIPLMPTLAVRIRHTQAQSSLAFHKRRDNLRGAFIIPTASQVLKNKHIVVIDDVMTTGHTLNEFAACLKRYGAASVTNLIFARTIAH